MYSDVDILDIFQLFNISQDASTINGSQIVHNHNTDIIQMINLLEYVSHFRVYFIPINAVLGILGNTITVLTLMTKVLRIQPMMHFVVAKCVADSFFLISLFIQWLQTLGYDLYGVGVWCHILSMVTQATNFLSMWFVVCLAVDRFIIVYVAGSDRPMCGILHQCPCSLFTTRIKFKPGGQMYIPGWTVLKSVITIIGLSLLAIAVYLNISVTMGVTVNDNGRVCTPLPSFANTVQVLGEVDLFINILFPNIIITSFTIVTFRRVFHFHVARKGTITDRSFSRQQYHFYSKSQLRLTVLSAAICGFYTLLTAPTQILKIQYSIQEMIKSNHSLTIHEYFWQHVLLIVYFMAFSINLIVVMLFHKGFRKGIGLLFTKIHCKIKCCFQTRDNPPGSMHAIEFAVEFSSTFVKINDKSVRDAIGTSV